MKKGILVISVLSIFIFLPLTAGTTQMIKYGFLDSSIDPSSYNPNWRILTHICYMEWGDDGLGNLKRDGTLELSGDLDNYNAVKKAAQTNGSKIVISVTCREADTIDDVLANHQDRLADNVLAAIQTYGADGVNFDFEWVRPKNEITQTSNTALIENMMKKIYTKIKYTNSNYHVSIDIDNQVAEVWQNKDLNSYVDNVILCGYDYGTPWNNNTTGPNAPYDDPIRWDVRDSIEFMLNYYDNQKIVLGIPFYGYEYVATSEDPGATTKQYREIFMKSATVDSYKYGMMWDYDSHTPWYRYKAENNWHQVWYDNSKSIELKYNYAKSRNLGGVSFWALGMEDSNVWEVLR